MTLKFIKITPLVHKIFGWQTDYTHRDVGNIFIWSLVTFNNKLIVIIVIVTTNKLFIKYSQYVVYFWKSSDQGHNPSLSLTHKRRWVNSSEQHPLAEHSRQTQHLLFQDTLHAVSRLSSLEKQAKKDNVVRIPWASHLTHPAWNRAQTKLCWGLEAALISLDFTSRETDFLQIP